MKPIPYQLATLIIGAILMTQMPKIAAAAPDAATDPRIDPQVRPFWRKSTRTAARSGSCRSRNRRKFSPGCRTRPPVDMSGVTTDRKDHHPGRAHREAVHHEAGACGGKPGVLLFIHGGVWIVGNFQNHQRLLRDLVVGSGQIGVFVEYTPLPAAKFPTQLEECYAALKWVAEHAGEFGADGSRIAVAGNSVGGNMTAALTLMAQGPQRTQDQLSGALDSGDGCERRYRVLSRVRDRPLPGARVHEVWLGPLRSRREDARQSLRVAAAGEQRGTQGPAAGARHHRRERSAARRGRGVCPQAQGGRR